MPGLPRGGTTAHVVEREVAGPMKKVFGWLVVGFLIFYIVTKPDDAAGFLRSLGDILRDVAVGIGQFVSDVF
jgi:hypothetical protein